MNAFLGLVAAIVILVITGGTGWLFALIALFAGFVAQQTDDTGSN